MFNQENDDMNASSDVFRINQHNVPGDNYRWEGEEVDEDVEPNEYDSQQHRYQHNQLMGHYRRELDVQYLMRMEMATDEAIYDHDQWPDDLKQELEARGQVPLVYNVVFTSVNWILGSQRQKPMDHSILPRRKEGLKHAERKTELLKYLSDMNHKPMHESRAFGEVVKAGLSWMETGVQDPDAAKEAIYERYESWRNIIYDTAATEVDLSDGRYRRVRKSVGQSGCFPVFGFGSHSRIPLLELLAQGAVESSCAGLQHEVCAGF